MAVAVMVGVGVAVIRVNLNSNMPFACKQKATEHRQPRMRWLSARHVMLCYWYKVELWCEKGMKANVN